jgi:hypothetical protein
MLNLDRATILLARLPIIDRESGQLYPFELRYNQYLAKEKKKSHQARIGGKIRTVYVKARRVGVSSLEEGFATCHIAASANARAKIVACLSDTSKELFDVPTNLIKNWPFPLPEPLATKITYPHRDGDSTMTIMTAQTAIAGRGGRCTFLHLSEAAFFPVGGGAFTSLFNSVPDDPDTSIVVESTAFGKVGIGEAFYEFWQAAVRGDTEFLAIFLTWLDDPHCRRDPQDIQFKECNEDEKDIIAMVACSDKCERCDRCNKALSCIAWRRWAIPNLCQGKVDKFRQEYPITADEAFYSSTSQAYEREELRYARECISAAPSPLIGRLTQELDGYGNPIRDRAKFIADPRSPLTIWSLPQPTYNYYLGADCARGIANTDDARIREGKDYAALALYCGQTGEQCLRYSAKIGPEQLAALIYVIAIYYNNALVNIELTGNLGLWAQSVLRDRYKYRNFARWKGRDDRMPDGYAVSKSIGFEMNSRTRPLILETFRGALQAHRVIPRDPILLQQMEAAEMLDGEWQVPDKIHDDVMVSNLVSWVTREQWHRGLSVLPPKLLLGTETSLVEDDLASAKAQVRGAKGDVEQAIDAHFKKIMAAIKAGGPRLTENLTPDPSKAGGMNRLAGI